MAWGTSSSAARIRGGLRGSWRSWQLWLCSSPGPPTECGTCSPRPCTPRRTWCTQNGSFSPPLPSATRICCSRGAWRKRTSSAPAGGLEFSGRTGKLPPPRETRSSRCAAAATATAGTRRGPLSLGFWTLITSCLLRGSPSRLWGSSWTGSGTSWRRCCCSVGSKESSVARATSAPWVCRKSSPIDLIFRPPPHYTQKHTSPPPPPRASTCPLILPTKELLATLFNLF